MALQGYELQLAERLLSGRVVFVDDVIATLVSSPGNIGVQDIGIVQGWEEELDRLKLEKWYLDYDSLYETLKNIRPWFHGWSHDCEHRISQSVGIDDIYQGKIHGGIAESFVEDANDLLMSSISDDTWRELFMIEGDITLMYAMKKVPYIKELFNDKESRREKLETNAGGKYMDMFKPSGNVKRDWNDWSTGRRAIRDNIVTDHPIQNLQEDITNQLIGITLRSVELIHQLSGDRLVATLSIFSTYETSSLDIYGFEFKIYERGGMYYGSVQVPRDEEILPDTWAKVIEDVRFYGGVIMVLVKQ